MTSKPHYNSYQGQRKDKPAPTAYLQAKATQMPITPFPQYLKDIRCRSNSMTPSPGNLDSHTCLPSPENLEAFGLCFVVAISLQPRVSESRFSLIVSSRSSCLILVEENKMGDEIAHTSVHSSLLLCKGIENLLHLQWNRTHQLKGTSFYHSLHPFLIPAD